MMLRGRSRAVAKQTRAADHRSHSQTTPTQNRHQQNPSPLFHFLSKFRQFAAGTPSSDLGRRRSWELESDSRGISLIVAAGRSKLVLFGSEIRVRTGDPGPDSPVSSKDPILSNRRFPEKYYLRRNSRRGESFLSSCYTCKKIIEPTADIYIYRGEKAFCSGDCRHTEILLQDTAGVNDEDQI